MFLKLFYLGGGNGGGLVLFALAVYPVAGKITQNTQSMCCGNYYSGKLYNT